MTEILVTERSEQTTAVLRERVPMGEMPAFFERAFHATMAAMQAQGVHPVGPPIGKYYGMPSDIVDVEAGFPASAAITAADGVTAGTLPGGKVVEAVHVGPFDTMQQTYDELTSWVRDQGLVPGEVMWETYLSDPEKEPDPATWRTQISWPVAE
jgi:effector-binding domain-containing protein